jgi:prepilin-type N-terminal cleavage/methylation domain-containing protein
MKQKGFTLIELLVVVAIIGILAAVGVVAYSGYTASAKRTSSELQFKNVFKSIKLTYIKCETDPSDRLKFASYSGGAIYNLSCSQFNEGNMMDGWFDKGKCSDLYYGDKYVSPYIGSTKNLTMGDTTCRSGSIATSNSTKGVVHLKGKNQTGNGCITLSMNIETLVLKEEICQAS